jgi:hypothetical protein
MNMSLGPSAAPMFGGINVLPTLVVLSPFESWPAKLIVLHTVLSVGLGLRIRLAFLRSTVDAVSQLILSSIDEAHVSGEHHFFVLHSFVSITIDKLPLIFIGVTID